MQVFNFSTFYRCVNVKLPGCIHHTPHSIHTYKAHRPLLASTSGVFWYSYRLVGVRMDICWRFWGIRFLIWILDNRHKVWIANGEQLQWPALYNKKNRAWARRHSVKSNRNPKRYWEVFSFILHFDRWQLLLKTFPSNGYTFYGCMRSTTNTYYVLLTHIAQRVPPLFPFLPAETQNAFTA